jgi:hypothetical protein
VKDFSLFGKKFILENDSSSIGGSSDSRIPKSAKMSDNLGLLERNGVKTHQAWNPIDPGNRFTQSCN